MDRSDSYRDTYCVIGAGTCGLAAARNLHARGIPVQVLEEQDSLGGNWYYGSPNSSMYDSAHLISSKRLGSYTDFPMPDDYPDYPGHRHVLAYLQSYAAEHGLERLIEPNSPVTRVAPAEGGGWDITIADREQRRYAGVIVANGHHREPLFPDLPGEFTGESLHSSQYKRPDVFTGKRVLIIGGGNSGCDIAVDSVPFSARVIHSMRRGYYFFPKIVMGKPIDEINELTHKLRMPLPLRRFVAGLMLRAHVGRNTDYGLPEPDHKLFESHLIVNSRLLYHLKHGDITPKPDVAKLRGDIVEFSDGSEEQIDLILYATGFKPAWPFLDTAAGAPSYQEMMRLYASIFHPQYDGFFVAGLVQPDVGIWRLADLQSQLIARVIEAQQNAPDAAAWFRARKRGPLPRLSPYAYQESERHRLEVEHTTYERLMRNEIARLDRQLANRPRRPAPQKTGV